MLSRAGFFFWYFAWEAPLELFAVFIMVAMELDWLSSLAGISATLLLLPMQVRVACVCRYDMCVSSFMQEIVSSRASEHGITIYSEHDITITALCTHRR